MLLERVNLKNFSSFVRFFNDSHLLFILLFFSLQTALILADSPQLFLCYCPDKTYVL